MAEAATAPGPAPVPDPGPSPQPASRTVGGTVLLRDRYLIDSDSPLPQLDSPSAKAFSVEDRRDPARKLFALICTPGLPPRAGVMALLRGCNIRGVLPLVEYSVAWSWFTNARWADGSWTRSNRGRFASTNTI